MCLLFFVGNKIYKYITTPSMEEWSCNFVKSFNPADYEQITLESYEDVPSEYRGRVYVVYSDCSHIQSRENYHLSSYYRANKPEELEVLVWKISSTRKKYPHYKKGTQEFAKVRVIWPKLGKFAEFEKVSAIPDFVVTTKKGLVNGEWKTWQEGTFAPVINMLDVAKRFDELE